MQLTSAYPAVQMVKCCPSKEHIEQDQEDKHQEEKVTLLHGFALFELVIGSLLLVEQPPKAFLGNALRPRWILDDKHERQAFRSSIGADFAKQKEMKEQGRVRDLSPGRLRLLGQLGKKRSQFKHKSV